MTNRAHECPTCRCTPLGPAKTWADQHLIHTSDQHDILSVTEAFMSYLRWFREQEQAQTPYTQNKLTRWLRSQGHRIELASRGNHLIGYRLAP